MYLYIFLPEACHNFLMCSVGVVQNGEQIS